MAEPTPAPAGASCVLHPGTRASFVCPRCGDFACEACAFRAHVQSQPMCGTCWQKRSEHVEVLQKDDRLHRPTVALWLGIASLIPFLWPAQVAGFILSIVCLVKMAKEPKPVGRGRAVAGLLLSIAGALGSVAILVAMVLAA